MQSWDEWFKWVCVCSPENWCGISQHIRLLSISSQTNQNYTYKHEAIRKYMNVYIVNDTIELFKTSKYTTKIYIVYTEYIHITIYENLQHKPSHKLNHLHAWKIPDTNTHINKTIHVWQLFSTWVVFSSLNFHHSLENIYILCAHAIILMLYRTIDLFDTRQLLSKHSEQSNLTRSLRSTTN